MTDSPSTDGLATVFDAGDTDEKTADGHQLLNLGGTTGALKGTVTGRLDADESDGWAERASGAPTPRVAKAFIFPFV